MLSIGIITDVHGNTKACKKLMKLYEKECDAIIVPGDLARTMKEKDNERILKVLSKSKLPVYVMPGNYESKQAYSKAIKKYKRKHIHDCLKKPTAVIKGKHFVFVPGSDLLSRGGSYYVVNNKREAKQVKKNFPWPVHPIILPNITKHLRKDSILISHSPCKLPGKHSIDLAISGKPTKYFVYREKKGKKVIAELITKRAIFGIDEARELKKKGYPIKIKEVHAGLANLTKAIKKKGVTKFVSGHIHEAGRRAVTLSGRKVVPRKWSKQLFYNPGEAYHGYGGIVEFKDGMARFKNVKV